MLRLQVVAIAKTNYAVAEEDPFGGNSVSVMDRSNDDPIIWHERVLQVCMTPKARSASVRFFALR